MVQIQLEEKVATALADRARSRGLSLEEYLAAIASGEAGPSDRPISGDEAIRLIEAEAGPGNRSYEGSYSREDIYLDHH